MQQEIILYGDVPSKKNSRILSTRGGRARSFPSKNYTEWHKDASTQLLSQKIESMACACSVLITFYPRTKRKADLTNKAESIMDLLVDNNIIDDDNWYEVPHVSLAFGEVDKDNPRSEIYVTEIK